jgi:hypothetical protein
MGSSRLSICLLLFIGTCINAFCFQQAPSKLQSVNAGDQLKEIGKVPKQIKEASGLEITNGKNFWTHNDGGVPMLFCLDSVGNLKRTLQLNHPNSGWEDLTLDSDGTLYVGAFGNNNNDKKSLKIYIVPNPDNISEKVYNAGTIEYTYEDQHSYPAPASMKNFDVDAFTAMGDSLYLFTKNRTSPFTGYTKVYALPQKPGKYTAQLIDSIYVGNGNMMDSWVTAADLSPDGKTLALLSHQYIWIIKDFPGTQFSKGKVIRMDLNHLSHKAGLAFKDNSTVYIVDELEYNILGGKVYQLHLDKVLSNQ